MNKHKRKAFFIKDNFQVLFIARFILLLLIEIITASFLIYKLSSQALENAAYSSHLSITTTAQIIKPIIFKINAVIILLSLVLASIAIAFTYFKLHKLFNKIEEGLENIKNNNTSFRITPYGGKNTQELIKDFNHAALVIDTRRNSLIITLNSILKEQDLKRIQHLHQKLFSIIANKN